MVMSDISSRRSIDELPVHIGLHVPTVADTRKKIRARPVDLPASAGRTSRRPAVVLPPGLRSQTGPCNRPDRNGQSSVCERSIGGRWRPRLRLHGRRSSLNLLQTQGVCVEGQEASKPPPLDRRTQARLSQVPGPRPRGSRDSFVVGHPVDQGGDESAPRPDTSEAGMQASCSRRAIALKASERRRPAFLSAIDVIQHLSIALRSRAVCYRRDT